MTRVLSRFRSSGLLVLAVMLAVLLGVLAVLQYRWVGQLSADERDRMRKHLHGRADDLADDFNRELTRIFVWLQVGPDVHRGAVDEAGADEQRYEHWFTAAPHPELVKAIYQIDVDEGGTITFRQYQRARSRVESVDWPAELEPVRAALKIVSDPLPGLDHAVPRLARLPLLWPDVPAVLIPRARVFSLLPSPRAGAQPQVLTNSGYTVALLNLPYMREQLLPQLVTRYFPDEGGRGRTYVAIRSATDVIYATPGALPTILKASDVDEGLWDIRFSEFSRFVIDRRPPSADRREALDEKAGQVIGKVTKEGKHGDASGSVNLYYARDERGRGPGGGPVTGGLPVWRVHLLDKAGSLEAAVGRARWRNLVISFTVLVLLGASMSLVLLSSARARRLAAQQMEFVAGVSHELRTPLTVIRSAGENLADGIIVDEQQVRKYGALIATEGRRLTQMVEQVMTFAGLQAGKPGLDVRAVDTSLVIDEALVAMAPLLRDQEAIVERDVPDELPRMLADASAVSRCIQNLLGNALKYASGGPGAQAASLVGSSARQASGASEAAAQPGRIRISARATPRLGGDQVAITVSDNGPGISPRDLPHIFEPFYRGADVVSLQIHGSGLGLSLVQRIMDELGGSVTVESELGHGSAFTLHLPVAPNAVAASNAATNAVQAHPLGGGADAQVRS